MMMIINDTFFFLSLYICQFNDGDGDEGLNAGYRGIFLGSYLQAFRTQDLLMHF